MRRALCICLASVLPACLAAAAPRPPAIASGLGPDRQIDGVGDRSPSATARLRIDYPDPRRSQPADLLLRPGHGAALPQLEGEIRGDGNATQGADPATMRTVPGAPIAIRVDPAGPGARFDGIGATSGGGATSRLLIDYPEPQRSQILDLLFAPERGAALQAMKVEIGADGNSTEGAEPTHMRGPPAGASLQPHAAASDRDAGSIGAARNDLGAAADENYHRGYQWWLMKEAVKRNPDIVLSALAWNFPAWVGNPASPAAADYLVRWVLGAKREHGLHIDNLGLWNETQIDRNFIKTLRAALDQAGLQRTRIAADDLVNDWTIVDALANDPEMLAATAIIATHYPRFGVGARLGSAERAREFAARWGKPLWATEDGPWGDAWGVSGEQSPPLAELLNRNYVQGRMTSTNIWNLISSYYDTLELPYAGLMRADRPWSGHFEVKSPLWVVAHTTQFTRPGWRYLDAASRLMPGGGSHVVLTDGREWTMVVETLSATAPQPFALTVVPEFGERPVHVWRSTPTSWFERVAILQPGAGRLEFTADANAVYTLTTLAGGGKATPASPPDQAFPAPFADGFDDGEPGQARRWFADLNGAFEVGPCAGGRPGRCLNQQTATIPIGWTYWRTMVEMGAPTITGSSKWRDYRVAADARLDDAGWASVLGRVIKVSSEGAVNGYQLRVHDDGRWELLHAVKDGVLAQGTVGPGRGRWRRLELAMHGDRITATVDGRQVAAIDDPRWPAGMAGVGTGWNLGGFDNFAVTAIAPQVPIVSAPPVDAATKPPPAPRLFVPAASDKAVLLRWSEVPGATGYRARIGLAPGEWDTTVEVGPGTQHNFRTLTNGTTYHFEVVAVNAAGESPGAGQYATPNPLD